MNLVMIGIHLLSLAGAIPEAERLALAEHAFDKGLSAMERPGEARRYFRQAAMLYEELERDGIRNSDLYLNLGNAEYLAGNVGSAILAYWRGLRVSPNDVGLHEALQYAREKTDYGSSARPATTSWPRWLPYPGSVAFMILAWLTYAFGWLALARRTVNRSGIVWVFVFWTIAALALVISVAHEIQQTRDHRSPLVVVNADHVPFCRGNGEAYPRHDEMPTLNQGMEARRLYERGDWLQIQLPGGQVGWVHKKHVLVDERHTKLETRNQT
jgi:tetratricopeptide (TPR) repeat protein